MFVLGSIIHPANPRTPTPKGWTGHPKVFEKELQHLRFPVTAAASSGYVIMQSNILRWPKHGQQTLNFASREESRVLERLMLGLYRQV